MVEKLVQRKIIGVRLDKMADGCGMQSDGTFIVTGKFTSDQKDEVGDIITRAATERAIPKYRQWGNIRYMHQARPVGKVIGIGTDDGLAWNEVKINVIDPQAVFEVSNGLLQALSVGILINIDDIDFLEDGGLIINDYDLAEISLVDHPANYDAKLDLSIDPEFRQYAREKGIFQAQLDWPLKALATATAKKDLEPVGEKPIMETEKSPEAVVVEAPVAETSVTSEVVTEVVADAPVAVEPVVEAVVAVEEPAVAEVVPAEEEEPGAVPNPVEVLQSQLSALSNIVANLAGMVEKMVKTATPVEQVEAVTEKALNDEQPVVSEPDAEKEALLAENTQLKEKLVEMSTPADRKGALPTEELPTEKTEVVVDRAASAETKAIGLRAAVKRFAENHK